jgi:hypothetical protein
MLRVLHDDLAGLLDPALGCMIQAKRHTLVPRRKSPTGKVKTQGGLKGGVKGTRK